LKLLVVRNSYGFDKFEEYEEFAREWSKEKGITLKEFKNISDKDLFLLNGNDIRYLGKVFSKKNLIFLYKFVKFFFLKRRNGRIAFMHYWLYNIIIIIINFMFL
jgi:hypothetical protein